MDNLIIFFAGIALGWLIAYGEATENGQFYFGDDAYTVTPVEQ